MEKKTPNPTQTHDVTSNPRPADAGWHALPVGHALGGGAPLDARWGRKGQSLSDPKNHYLRTLLLGLHAPCAAQRGAERLERGAGKTASGTDGKRLLRGQPISDMMHNHIPDQLGFVSVVPGIAWCGDEDEEEYLQWIITAREPQPDEGTIGLGRSLSLSSSGPQGKT